MSKAEDRILLAQERFKIWMERYNGGKDLDISLNALDQLQLVNTKQALELHELGFNLEGTTHKNPCFFVPSKRNPDYNDRVWRPTCQLVFKWLRWKHNLEVYIIGDDSIKKYNITIGSGEKVRCDYQKDFSNTTYDAMESIAVDEAIKILKEKKSNG